MRRIFIGVKASKEIEELALRWQNDKAGWPVRWIKPANLHLTLVPPFYENDIALIAERLAGVELPEKPIVVRYKIISYGPRLGNFRLIWTTGQSSPKLENLKAKIEERLNLKTEHRNLLPHLTLARFRPEDFPRLKLKNLYESIDWREEIKSFEIFESFFIPAGSEYKILGSFPV